MFSKATDLKVFLRSLLEVLCQMKIPVEKFVFSKYEELKTTAKKDTFGSVILQKIVSKY